MITRLRTRHRTVWLALAVVLPVLLVAAWFARRPAPVMEKLPAELRAPSP